MPEHRSHRKPGVALHFRKMVKEVTQVVDMQRKDLCIFNSIDVVDVRLPGHEAPRRIGPLFLIAEVLAHFLIVFNEISPQQPFLNEIAFGAYVLCMVDQLSFFKMLPHQPLTQGLFQRIA